ncbi:hypothetical protein F5144DRAFT_592358 [Chaetomium tenue]|uniref:Uncharacterized protein n=1 Tax=Chaetomium tenue TaxID=1854479 RepID=A0ACB7P4T2_9PEZI|nr:hypothetical protein F5144DRAFT_592358 [Chaetomium globosum]
MTVNASNNSGARPFIDDDLEPSRRECIHDDEKLCKWNLNRLVSSFPLEIRSSTICKGSGLFTSAAIPEGHEIYHVLPTMDNITADNPSFCSYCLKNTQEVLGGPSKANEETKACSRCKVARYCSKFVRQLGKKYRLWFRGGSSQRYLRVRSIKPIAAGEEITICYVDPALTLTARKAFLQHEYFFDCSCNRCKAERKECSSLLGGTEKLSTLPQYQQDIVQLIGAAVKAAKYPGVFPDYEDPAAIETRLRTITVNAFPPGKSWPEHMEPLPSARLSLAMLYLGKGQPVPALRNALKAQLLSSRRRGREWVNDMMDVITILIVAASLPPDSSAFMDKKFPPSSDIHNVTVGYFIAAADQASGVFGAEAEYAKGISHMTNVMAKQKGPPMPGSKEFIEAFVSAQRKLLEWAGIPEENAVVIRGM